MAGDLGPVDAGVGVALVVAAAEPLVVDAVEEAHGFGPDDELGEALHEEDEGEVEGEVEEGPDLLADGGEVGVVHPIVVDEEDEVDCCGGCGDDADDLGV